MSEIDMTDEIIKLYKNAGIEKIKIFWCGEYDCLPKEHPQGYQINCFKNCGLCSYTEYKYIYPPFTSKKQLELIKWLSDTDYYITEFCRLIDTREYYIETNYKHFQSSSFEDTLAGLINNIWQDLSEKEKQQIKEILANEILRIIQEVE